MNPKGLILSLAFPDIFVKATDGRYNRFLSKIGIVNNGVVRAGHAAAVLIWPDGLVRYTDFGRYITPKYKGRCRTEITDPDVAISVRAIFDGRGQIVNLDEIVDFLSRNGHITHGEGVMFLGLHEHCDVDRAYRRAKRLSLKGSIDYGPFVVNGNNCSRYVWGLLWRASASWWDKLRLLYNLWPSPMPLDMVRCASAGNRWRVGESDMSSFKMGRWKMWMRLFEKPGSAHLLKVADFSRYGGRGDFLESVGASSWFTLESYSADSLHISRRNERGRVIFSYDFNRPQGFDPEVPFRFVFDCNARFCTIWQKGKILRVERKIKNSTSASEQRLSL